MFLVQHSTGNTTAKGPWKAAAVSEGKRKLDGEEEELSATKQQKVAVVETMDTNTE